MQVYTYGLGPSLGLHRFVHAFPALMLRQPRLEESMLPQLYVLVFTVKLAGCGLSGYMSAHTAIQKAASAHRPRSRLKYLESYKVIPKRNYLGLWVVIFQVPFRCIARDISYLQRLAVSTVTTIAPGRAQIAA